MYLTRSTISSNKSAYETGFEKSFVNTLMLCDFFAKRDSIFSDSEIQIQSNRFRFAGFIQWLFFILSHFIVSPVNCYCYWDYAVSDQRRCWRSSEISNQAIYEYGGFCSEKISKTEITCILI